MVIVLTDGKSNRRTLETLPQAQALRETGAKVISVGITQGVKESEVKAISSFPQVLNEDYFLTPNFESLYQILTPLISRTCVTLPPQPTAITFPQPTTEEPHESCKATVIDLIILIDESGSIKKSNPEDGSYDNWQLLINFVKKVASSVTIGVDANHISIVSFSDKGKVIFDLNEYYTINDVLW